MCLMRSGFVLVAAMNSVVLGCGEAEVVGVPVAEKDAPKRAMGVCPPFQLRDEGGNVIDPVQGVNDAVPYSPKQTCGCGN